MSSKITFTEITEELAESAGVSHKLSHSFVSSLVEMVIEETVDSGKASITNFGSFKQVEVAERNGVNPQTGEEIVIPAHQRISFTPYKALEQNVNLPFAHLQPEIIEEEEEDVTAKDDDTTVGEATPFEPQPPITSGKEDPNEIEDKIMGISGGGAPPPEELDLPDETGETLSEEWEEDQEESTPPPVFRREGKDNERNVSVVLMGVLALIVILSGFLIWFFASRSNSDPEITQAGPPPVDTPAIEPEPIQPRQTEEPPEEILSDNEPRQEESIAQPSPEPEAALTENEDTEPEFISYTVQEDEWFYDIARTQYESPELWPLIFEANFSTDRDPDLLLPSTNLSIPQVSGSIATLTDEIKTRLAAATLLVSEAYANAGKDDKAVEYRQLAQEYANE